ncbi:uncharacterized protein LOC141915945 [Strix aluco]|uniref:uncharacterized protein LOC141915945 n=1 Tax=Strix aluco TaxID=111821 RepID=UPI003DA4166B
MEPNAPPAAAKRHPGAGSRAGGCHGTLVQERVPLGTTPCPRHQPGRERPTAPPGQAGLDPTTGALHLPLLFGPVEAVFEGQRGRSAAESSGSRHPQELSGFPEAARPLAGAAETRGPGVEYLCFIFLIKTKASKVAQRGPAVRSRHPPAKRDLGKAQRPSGSGTTGQPGLRLSRQQDHAGGLGHTGVPPPVPPSPGSLPASPGQSISRAAPF